MLELAVIKSLDLVLDNFAEKAIKRWSRYRAERFIEALVQNLKSKKLSDEETMTCINQALADASKSEVLFEAYRRVCLSASKNCGPRFVGLMTAELLVEDRVANNYEERLLMCAEKLSDQEFRMMVEFFASQKAAQDDNPAPRLTVSIEVDEQSTDSNMLGAIDISSINLGEYLGIWALKASSVGILTQRLTQTQESYEADSERFFSDSGITTTFKWTIEYETQFLDSVELMLKAIESRN